MKQSIAQQIATTIKKLDLLLWETEGEEKYIISKGRYGLWQLMDRKGWNINRGYKAY